MSETKRLRIVTADDDEMNLMILLKNIKDYDYTAIGFEEGDITWQYLEAHPNDVDLVLLDKMMTTMSGIEIMEHMQEHPVLKHIPVIIQSGDAAPDRIAAAMAAGAKGYITKPFGQQQLLDMIDQVVAGNA